MEAITGLRDVHYIYACTKNFTPTAAAGCGGGAAAGGRTEA